MPALLTIPVSKTSAATSTTIVDIFHPGATDGSGGGKDNVNLVEDITTIMVDEGVKTLTGKSTTLEAWSQIIPDPSKRVAIKVNCQITGIYTKAKVVQGIINGLLKRGVTEDNFIHL